MSTQMDVLTKLKKARLSLLFNNPFFGSLTMALPLVEADWLPTMAVDGRNIYYNREFVDGMTLAETIFVLCHEVMHVVYDHLGRRGHRDPEYHNMACDYVINAMLTDEKIGSMPTKPVEVKQAGQPNVQRVGLYDKKYAGWTSEAVYDDLLKRKVKKQLTLDVHLDLGKDAQSGDKGNSKGNGIPVEISEEDLKTLREELKNKVLQSALAAAGKLPAGIARLIDQLVEPQINWRDYLRETIQSQLTSDYSWQRPNRRHHGSDVIFASLVREEEVDVEVSIDMSGSISKEMARDMLSEVVGITQQYHHFNLGVSTFDTKVYNRQTFNSENVEELLEYDPLGGGGTDIAAIFRYYQKHDIRPKLLVVFTDLESHDYGPPDYCENVVWVVNNPYNRNIVPPFGSWVRYTREEGVIETGVA